uniref:uncharacterized protein isoform X2 n=1 Tax=Myxine glutinosa TaxID=7769 RepID=UPI00358DE107
MGAGSAKHDSDTGQGSVTSDVSSSTDLAPTGRSEDSGVSVQDGPIPCFEGHGSTKVSLHSFKEAKSYPQSSANALKIQALIHPPPSSQVFHNTPLPSMISHCPSPSQSVTTTEAQVYNCASQTFQECYLPLPFKEPCRSFGPCAHDCKSFSTNPSPACQLLERPPDEEAQEWTQEWPCVKGSLCAVPCSCDAADCLTGALKHGFAPQQFTTVQKCPICHHQLWPPATIDLRSEGTSGDHTVGHCPSHTRSLRTAMNRSHSPTFYPINNLPGCCSWTDHDWQMCSCSQPISLCHNGPSPTKPTYCPTSTSPTPRSDSQRFPSAPHANSRKQSTMQLPDEDAEITDQLEGNMSEAPKGPAGCVARASLKQKSSRPKSVTLSSRRVQTEACLCQPLRTPVSQAVPTAANSNACGCVSAMKYYYKASCWDFHSTQRSLISKGKLKSHHHCSPFSIPITRLQPHIYPDLGPNLICMASSSVGLTLPHATEAPNGKRKIFPWPRFRDSTVLHILRFLPADSRARCARVCRQWYHLAWDPRIWRNVWFGAAGVDVDRALAVIAAHLSCETPPVCLTIQNLTLGKTQHLSNCGLVTLARYCPELRRLELPSSNGITNHGLALVLACCTSLQHLNVSDCPGITYVSSTSPSTAHMAQGCHLSLCHLDMSGCTGFTLECLHAIALHCPALSHLYLRRCTAVTDSGLRILARHCPALREISMCDCPAITDVGIWELAQILRVGLRYLSVAHCGRLTDAALYHLANYCPGLRYLNVRGLPSLTDIGLAALSRGCPRLRSLDVGHCARLGDAGFEALAEGCPALRRLGLRGCHHVTSRGLRAIATGCPELRLLSLQGCLIPAEWLNSVRQQCRHCIIEHTNAD